MLSADTLIRLTVMQEQANNVKASAHELIDQLPEGVSWSQLAYHVEVRASIERGLDDAKAGRVYSSDQIRERLGLPR